MYAVVTWVLVSSGTQVQLQIKLDPNQAIFPFVRTMVINTDPKPNGALGTNELKLPEDNLGDVCNMFASYQVFK